MRKKNISRQNKNKYVCLPYLKFSDFTWNTLKKIYLALVKEKFSPGKIGILLNKQQPEGH